MTRSTPSSRVRLWPAGLAGIALVGCGTALAQPADATASDSRPSVPRAAAPAARPASTADDGSRKAELLASERWRRATFEFDQWLARQPVYTPAQVRRIKTDLATRVGAMSSFEVEYLLDTLEAKLTVLESPEAEEARSWLGRYLAVMADRKREEVLGEVPNILDMSSNELEAAVRRVEAKRNAVEQQHARTLETRDTTAALVEANRSRQEEERAAQASRPAAEVYSPYRAGGTDPPFSGTYESPTAVGVGPWGSFLLIPTTAF